MYVDLGLSLRAQDEAERLAEELVATEKTYVKGLKNIVHGEACEDCHV